MLIEPQVFRRLFEVKNSLFKNVYRKFRIRPFPIIKISYAILVNSRLISQKNFEIVIFFHAKLKFVSIFSLARNIPKMIPAESSSKTSYELIQIQKIPVTGKMLKLSSSVKK
jgi:hypothetical protein